MAQTKAGAIKSAAKQIGISVDEYLALIESGQKRCSECKQWKPVSSFNKDNSRSDGLYTRCHDCVHVKDRKITKGRVSTFKGHVHTEEAKQKMSESSKGKQPRLGIKHTLESREKISKGLRKSAVRGKDCHSYKDGKVTERRGQRFSVEYKRWRFDVYCRDKFTCQECGDNKGGNLNAHHIKPFADYPELRFDVSNGITLCNKCHDKIHFKADSIRNTIKLKRQTK